MEHNLSKDIILQAINSTRDGLIIAEAQGKDNPIVFANPAFERLSGYSQAEISGKDFRFLEGGEQDQTERAAIGEALEKGESILVTLRTRRKDGGLFWNELSISPIKNETGTVTHFVGIQKDVTETLELRKMLESRNQGPGNLSNQEQGDKKLDPLTGLYSRNVLENEVAMLWSTAQRTAQSVSVLFIDIDHFKRLNDVYGLEAGNKCLQHLAGIFKKHFGRKSDIAIRYGGEEFVLVLFGNKLGDVIDLANRLLDDAAEGTVELADENTSINFTVSVGVTVGVPGVGTELEQFIDTAEQAMHAAKRQGRNMVMFKEV